VVALSREATYAMIALGVVIVIGTLIGFRYATIDPCEMLRQDLLRGAEARGESLIATELFFQAKRDKLNIATCIAAYISTTPSTYIREL
jgi:hypothetical protein